VNPRASTGGRRGRLADLDQFEERTRQLKDYEMYSKLYYDEKIKRLVEEVEEELGSIELSKGEKLNLRKRIAKDLYEGEDEDVKVLVNAKLKERAKVIEDQKNDGIDRTPEQYLR
jgi:predicted metal-binding transcription factor (methanogenesis marker protein 9)